MILRYILLDKALNPNFQCPVLLIFNQEDQMVAKCHFPVLLIILELTPSLTKLFKIPSHKIIELHI
jgi:hypothetical protein